MAVAGFMDDTRLALDGIDAAVLAALYRTEVESGGRYADQRDALADATLRALTARAR
jgi:hypothetical protein